MLIPNTYRNKFGVYYFRWTKRISAYAPPLQVRFSLRTRNPLEAKTRANLAWLYAQIYFSEQGGDTAHLTAAHMRQQLQRMLFDDAGSAVEYDIPKVGQLLNGTSAGNRSVEYRNTGVCHRSIR